MRRVCVSGLVPGRTRRPLGRVTAPARGPASALERAPAFPGRGSPRGDVSARAKERQLGRPLQGSAKVRQSGRPSLSLDVRSLDLRLARRSCRRNPCGSFQSHHLGLASMGDDTEAESSLGCTGREAPPVLGTMTGAGEGGRLGAWSPGLEPGTDYETAYRPGARSPGLEPGTAYRTAPKTPSNRCVQPVVAIVQRCTLQFVVCL